MVFTYDGSPHASAELRLAFPLGKVESYQSRRADGTTFYDIRGGKNAFVLDGYAFFAGDEVKNGPVKFEAQPVAPSIEAKAEKVPSSEVHPEAIKNAAWHPDPPPPEAERSYEWHPDPPAARVRPTEQVVSGAPHLHTGPETWTPKSH